jgi:RimJ/RimL family protein N-acetyltransferase
VEHVRGTWGDPAANLRLLREPPASGNRQAIIEADGHEVDAQGRGFGSAAINRVAELALSDPTVPFLMACTRLDNLASQRAFAKAGFRKDREFDDVPNGLHVLLLRHRQEGQAA